MLTIALLAASGMGFRRFPKNLCWNAFHQLLLPLVEAGGGSGGPTAPSEEEFEALGLGHDRLPHREMRWVRDYRTPQVWGICVLVKLWSGHLTFSSLPHQPHTFVMRWRDIWWEMLIFPTYCMSVWYFVAVSIVYCIHRLFFFFFSIAPSGRGFSYTKLSNL